MANILQRLNVDVSTIAEVVRKSLVQIRNRRWGQGAGTIWHPNGLILTNAHVVGSHTMWVTLPDGRKLPARILARSSELDLAALTVRARRLPTIELGQSEDLRPGQWVLAMGNPGGTVGAVTTGIVIDVGVPHELPALSREVIQVNLPLRPGYSGGPLVDVQGRLVGINTLMAGPEAGFAVPVHEVKRFLRESLATR